MNLQNLKFQSERLSKLISLKKGRIPRLTANDQVVAQRILNTIDSIEQIVKSEEKAIGEQNRRVGDARLLKAQAS